MSDTETNLPPQATSSPRKGLEIKDRITIGLSTAALLVAASGFYYQNLRVQGRIAATTVAPYVGGRGVEFEFAIFNTGNRAVLVDSACVISTTMTEGDRRFECADIDRPPDLPVVLEPGRIFKTKVRRDDFDWEAVLPTSLPPEGFFKNKPGWRKIPIGLRFVVF